MNLILFSKDASVLKYWKDNLGNSISSHYDEIIECETFAVLGSAIADENHILIYHLASGDDAEKVCYQFIMKYQQQHKMMVLTKKPNDTQGLRIFRSGVHGYTNAFLSGKKLQIAIEVIEQGKIWIGAEILKTLISDCSLNIQANFAGGISNASDTMEEAQPKGFIDSLLSSMKNIFK